MAEEMLKRKYIEKKTLFLNAFVDLRCDSGFFLRVEEREWVNTYKMSKLHVVKMNSILAKFNRDF